MLKKRKNNKVKNNYRGNNNKGKNHKSSGPYNMCPELFAVKTFVISHTQYMCYSGSGEV